MNEMNKTRKKRLMYINILTVSILCLAVFGQVYFSATKLFAKEPLSLTLVEEKISENQAFHLDISDSRGVEELNRQVELEVPQPTIGEETDSVDNEPIEIKKELNLFIPQGITFDIEAEENMLQEEKESELPVFSWNETKRILTISMDVAQENVRLLLTADASGEYIFELSDAIDSTKRQELEISVEGSSEIKALEEIKTLADEVSVSTTADNTAEITDWQSFVEALADTSITTISLQNDIRLSGVLQNYDGLFSTDTVDMASAENVYFHINKAASSRSITINGNGHTFDFGNLAIGLLNASTTGSSQGFWIFDFVNIDVISKNFSGPIYKSSHTAASATTNGLTGAARTNTQINFGSEATHTRQVETMLGYLVALHDYNVPNIEITADLFTTAGTFATSYFAFSPSGGASQQIFRSTTRANTSGGMVHNYFDIAGTARKVVVEGNGYTLDFGAIVHHFVAANNNGGRSWDISFNNMNVYHGNYWGALIYDSGGKMTLKDYRGYGSQFMEAGTTELYIDGDTHLEQQATYTSIGKNGDTIRTWSVNNERQSSLSVSSAKVLDNAKFYLSSRGSNVLDINGGNFDVGEGAQVTFERGNIVTTAEGGNTNVTLRNSASLTIGKNATVNMVNNHAIHGTVINLQGTTSVLTVKEGAVLNVLTTAYNGTGNTNPGTTTGTSQTPIWMSGGTISIDGSLNVKGENMGASNTNLIHANAASTFTINAKGSLDVQSDSTSYAQNLIYMGGTATTTKFQFSDAVRVNLQKHGTLTGTNNASSGLISSGGILDVSVQNVYQWSYGNMNGSADDSGSDFQYEPMSNMRLTYGGNAQPTITLSNAMTSAILNNFNQNFTTQAQRVLFTRVPDPNIAIHSVATDNHGDSSSITVHGYAIPNAYIRLWDVPVDNSISPALDPSTDNVVSPVEDTTTPIEFRNNFTTQSNANGDWSITVPSGNYFTAGSVIHAYGFASLKAEEVTQTVLDKTPPTASGVTYYISLNDGLPDPKDMVKDVADTSPINTGFDFAYDDPEAAAQAAQTPGEHTVKIKVSDRAVNADGQADPNTTVVDSTLIVYDEGAGVSGADFEASYVDIRGLSEPELITYILENSKAEAFMLSGGIRTDLSQFVTVTDFGGLNDIANIQPKEYPVTLTVKAADSGLAQDITGTIKVTVVDVDAVLTVEFINELGQVLPGYTITIDSQVGDKIDLTKEERVTKQLTDLESAGYEIAERPGNETEIVINNTEVTVRYKLQGILSLASAPNALDFGSLTYNATTKRVDDPSIDQPLIVTDTRADTANGWTLTASLSTPMRNTEGQELVNALRYVYRGKETILDTNAQTVFLNADGSSGSIDISNSWGSQTGTDGVKLQIESSDIVHTGNYVGVITWKVMAGQP